MMKSEPSGVDDRELRQRLSPGVLSRDGFLGSDSRPVAEIIAADGAALAAAGVGLEQVAAVLERLHAAADAAPEGYARACEGRVTVDGAEVMGAIPCPFGCGHRAHKAVLRIEYGGKSMEVTPIGIHLIARHGFFQGRGSRFRIEPEQAAELVRLCAGSGREAKR